MLRCERLVCYFLSRLRNLKHLVFEITQVVLWIVINTHSKLHIPQMTFKINIFFRHSLDLYQHLYVKVHIKHILHIE